MAEATVDSLTIFELHSPQATRCKLCEEVIWGCLTRSLMDAWMEHLRERHNFTTGQATTLAGPMWEEQLR